MTLRVGEKDDYLLEGGTSRIDDCFDVLRARRDRGLLLHCKNEDVREKGEK